jgi:hypothetical protein
MNYLLFICSDGIATPEKVRVMRSETPAWVEEMDGRGVRRLGNALAPAASAVTVRVRDGETVVSDGPFVESKEFIAGFDVIDCDDLDEAIEVAGRHTLSWFHAVEVRPFAESAGDANPAQREPPAPDRRRYMLAMCLDGIPASDEEEAAVSRDSETWTARANARGARVYGHPLKHADTATTVRVRDGETLLSDGPFAETKEFIGGFAIVDCATPEEAIELAAAHPLARHHMIEVRPFAE